MAELIEYTQRARRLIEESCILQAINTLKECLEHRKDELSTSLKNKLIIYSNQFTDIKQKEHLSLINLDDKLRIQSNIIVGILSIIDSIEKAGLKKKIVASKKNNIDLEKKQNLIDVQLTIPGNFQNFTEDDRIRIKKIIGDLIDLDFANVIIKKIEEGSIKLTLSLPKEKANLLIQKFSNDEIKELELIDVKLLNSKIEEVKLLRKKSNQRRINLENVIIGSKDISFPLIRGNGNLLAIPLTSTYYYTLIDLIKGDRHAQEIFYKNYSSKIFTRAIRFSTDYREAEEILQQTFITIFNDIDKFKGETSFDEWIRIITLNTIIEYYKNNAHEHEEKINDEEIDESDSDRDFLLKILQKLSLGYRIVFNLYVIDGYSIKEISEFLSVSESVVKSQLARARVIFKKLIEKYNKYDR